MMSDKKENNKLIPRLRFPEFKDNGEWEEKNILEIASMKARIGWQNLRSEEHLDSGDYYLITGTNFNNGLIDWESAKYVSYERFIQDENIILKEGDTLITKDGSIGKIAYVENIGQKKATLNNGIFRIRPKTGNKKFIFYTFLSKRFKLFLQKLTAGSSITHLYQKDFTNYKIAIPLKLQEQQKIAAFLSNLDELIGAHRQKLELLKRHKKGLMQNLFPQEGEKVPKLRFPEFRDKGEWAPTTVEKNCHIKGRIGYRGYTKKDLVKKGEGALVLGGKHIQNKMLDLSDPTFLKWEKYYESPEIMVEINHIIFSQRGSLGDCAIIDRDIGKATINPSMVLIKDISCNHCCPK